MLDIHVYHSGQGMVNHIYLDILADRIDLDVSLE